MKIGLIVAMDKEYAQLQTVAAASTKNELILQKCGIGKVNAAIGTVEMILEHHPDVIVSTGCAGGADTHLQVGDIVAGTEYVYHDAYCGTQCTFGQILGHPARFQAAKELIEKAKSLSLHNLHTGLMVCGDWFVDSREKMSDILSHFPEALAVDMESCAIAQTCQKYQVPFISFRIVSDVPLSDHKAAQYFDFWARMADGSFQVTSAFLDSL